ncbi:MULTISPECIES: hypothetical protein [Polymorphospora]|uniref:Uncharacterized protein n=1 Tax=Polymorphospora lycopeni TaxID=3140240 RepID=A0ABV5CVN3_9ACTN
MRTKQILTAAIAAPLLLLGLAACSASTTTKKCSGNTCEVTVKTKSSAKTKIFKYDLRVSELKDDSVKVSYRGDSKTLKEGETATVGRVTVLVKDADPGEAELTVSR